MCILELFGCQKNLNLHVAVNKPELDRFPNSVHKPKQQHRDYGYKHSLRVL
ncbi:hypothetical protein FHT79_003459 [Rhizobium sp. BK212]|nr:hypothetical protein [Rhizobium sp. BK212]